MNIKHTGRGFALVEFRDSYGSACSLQKSSNAEDDHIWLGVDRDFENRECTRMHLTRDQVAALLPLLQRFVTTGEIEE